MKYISVILCLVLFSSLGVKAATTDQESNLVVLRNARVVVGVLPRVGGTVMVLRRPDGKNVFAANPALWGEADLDIPNPAANPPYKPYNGHTIWVGPQQTWGWPPDPYLMYGKFTITEQSATSLKLVGPASPICGLQLTKEISVHDDGIVDFTVTGTNTSAQNVSWDLWSITRLPAAAKCYVPLAKVERLRIEFNTWYPEDERQLGYTVSRDGFFSFDSEARFPQGICRELAKALLVPREGVLAAFYGDNLFLKRTTLTPMAQIYPSQSNTEIYQEINRKESEKSVLEMEFHGPYRTLAPGESMSLHESWQVLPYHANASRDSQLKFLRSLGIGSMK